MGVRHVGALAAALLASAACGSGAAPGTGSVYPPSSAAGSSTASLSARASSPSNEDALIDAAFRVDLRELDVTLDVYPEERRSEGRARVVFRMRAGQSRPVFHLEPAFAGGWQASLDGQPLDTRSAADVRPVVFEGGTQSALEIQRDLDGSADHVLEAEYRPAFVDAFSRFYTDVNDLVGRGNEALWPTINAPHELARHRVRLRVHSPRPYLCLGSGLVERTGASDAQEWLLDTEREVASYTVLFFLAPAADATLAERRVNGVEVRVLSPAGGPSAEEAFASLAGWLPELEAASGPLPMPRGLSIVLTPTGGGMEYYGGTITSLRALRHEVFHMYWGCSTVMRTYRDSWLDEAVTMWYELSANPAFPAIEEAYASDIVSARSPIAVGFDRRAYDQGARILQAMAQELGGREPAVAFLRRVHERHSFAPFTTMDFVEMLRADTGLDVRARWERWLYTPSAAAAGRSAWSWLHEVDLTPPEPVRARYPR